ncbi:MAG: rhomboid family intramembrane serine protease [Candidatus Aminicenantes bacterium]|nr:rhomboid family intramembrane serine protease [Candidatus Aminicenantes bacterium]
MALEPRLHVRPTFGRQEQFYFLKAGLLILAIYFFRREIYSLAGFFLLFLPLFFFCIIWFKSIQTGDRLLDIVKEHVTFIPIPYAEGGRRAFIPKVTLLLILLNVLAFYFVRLASEEGARFIVHNFTFLPRHVSGWNIWLSPVSSMFLHADAGHLWGNMISFWAFGPAVEERIGARKFVFLYFLTGIAGSLTAVVVFRVFMSETFHAIGASGAIAGITGVFLVRCYFKKLVVPLPLFGLLNFKLRINSLLPLGLFFLLDVRSGFEQLAGSRTPVAYWVHVGSLVAGILFSARMNLHRAAAEEKYTEAGLAAMDNQLTRRESVDSLLSALQLNPDNEAALMGLAREYAITRKPEGRDLFERAIRLKLRTAPEQAMAAYQEYRDSYTQMLEPELQYRLAGIFYRNDDHEPAARMLEAIILEPSANPDTRQRSFFQLIVLLAENNMLEAAHYRLGQFREQFPGSDLVQAAEDKFVEILKS